MTLHANTWHLGLAVVLIIAWASPVELSRASAQSDDRREQNAQRIFRVGKQAFDRGEYESAVTYFERAYELSPRPMLLYNIGVAAERAGMHERAISAFRSCIEQDPKAENREEIEARLEVLERTVARSKGADVSSQPSPETGEPQPETSEPSEPSDEANRSAAGAEGSSTDGGSGPRDAGGRNDTQLLGWVVLGTSAAVAATGAILFAVGMNDVSTVEDAPEDATWKEIRGPYERAPILTGTGLALLGVGLAGSALGIAWVAGDEATGTSIEVSVNPGTLLLSGEF
ncbi:MAG: tetratricopeptide repeat protein [Myxococcales bacterium]|nr:tetratricopeptide repeat protein [Myxococcales bacterium]